MRSKTFFTYLGLLALCLSLAVDGQPSPVPVDTTRARPLEPWKQEIAVYSQRHYGEPTWKLEPTCIVLHYTAMADFPWNLVRSQDFAGERPGLASHYVIDGAKVWQLLPTDVRSRASYGLNHRAINIEMMALDADDLARKTETLKTCQKLCRELMAKYRIPKDKIYSHEEVATMDRRVVPEVLDLVRPEPYHKIDPGVQNMEWVLRGL